MEICLYHRMPQTKVGEAFVRGRTAAFFSLKALSAQEFKVKHVTLLTDNSTAVTYINHMGGVKSRTCNEIAKTMWLWTRAKGIWLTASYLPGTLNIEADHEPRVLMIVLNGN